MPLIRRPPPLASLVLLVCVGCGAPAAMGPPDGSTASTIPLAPDSPWPKFRANPQQDGLSTIHPKADLASTTQLWTYRTGKGIFSSPVVGGDETVYIGSADRTFYAFAPDGTVKWKELTGEIIDSAALLDDKGSVYFGSGDGKLRAREAKTGRVLWTFAADDPAMTGAFINWFEGNVGMLPDGHLIVPNDNFQIYRINRDTGVADLRLRMPDQTWALPAVDVATSRMYVANNNVVPFLGSNFYVYEADGTLLFDDATLGSIAASPLLTPEGLVIVGGFDGYVRAWKKGTYELAWKFGARDHLYASPARLPDGTIIQPAADGTIYALDPASGAVRWTYDTREPIRSSPAVDGDGRIYVGSGEGRLFVLEPTGALRYSIKLITDDRDDMNSSPALGNQGIYIAGESGDVFGIPYDYCLRPMAESDPRCDRKGETFADGASLRYTSSFGALPTAPPDTIDPNQPIVLSLSVRQGGQSRLAVLDAANVKATVTPAAPFTTEVSGDGKFVVLTPRPSWPAAMDGKVSLSVDAPYLVDLAREGLKLSGGKPGGAAKASLSFAVRAADAPPFSLRSPGKDGDPSGVWELARLALPLPTLLPSYNQIGFDSLHYVLGLVDGDARGGVAWMVGAKLADSENKTLIDPATKAIFPLVYSYEGGYLTLENQDGLRVEVTSAIIPFRSFRVAAHLGAGGDATGPARLTGSTLCGQVPLYGLFLQKLGLCNPQTDVLTVSGAAIMRRFETGTQGPPSGLGTVTWSRTADAVTATIQNSTLKLADHVYAILIVDDLGKPMTLNYALATVRTADGAGNLASVRIPTAGQNVPLGAKVYLMVDTYPAARAPVPAL